MSTLPLRAPNVPAIPVGGFARAFAALNTLFDAFVEAQELARVAHKNHPFADW